MKHLLIPVFVLMAVTVQASDELPTDLNLRYAVDAEHGWEFLIVELCDADRVDVGDLEYVAYSASGEKVAMTRVGLVRDVNDADTLVGKVLVNPAWQGRYELVINARDTASGIFRSHSYDLRKLISAARERLKEGD